MVDLLELRDDVRAYPTPECRDIPEFAALVDRDDTEHKTEAARELAYVYHVVDPTSPYGDMDESVKKERVGADLFDDEEYEPDEKIQAAMEKYRELNVTESMMLLESARQTVHNLRTYFEEADFTKRDDNGKLVWKAKDAVRNLEKLGGVVESLNELKNQVEKEQHSQRDNRGGAEVNQYSR